MTNPRSRSRWLATSTLAATLAFSLLAAAKLSKTGPSTASFRAAGPAGLKIDGTTSEVGVADDGVKVTISVPLEKLTTGIDVRDRHMKEALEVGKFPKAELVVDRSALNFPKGPDETTGYAKATMMLHGQSKEVSIQYTAKVDGGVYNVKGNTRINMTDYGIKPPSYLGVSVKPEVTINVQFQAKDE